MEDDDEYFDSLMGVTDKGDVVKIDEVVVDRDLDEDFKIAKHRLEGIAAQVSEAVDDAAQMAKQMGEPRGYDALSKVVSAAVAANKAVVEVYRNKSEGKEADRQTAQTNITHHTTMLLTTAEMAEKLREIAGQAGVD